MSPYLLLAFAIGAEIVATSSLRLSEGFTRLVPSIVVVIGYGLAFYLLSLALKEIPLGIAYAIWSGVGTAITAVIAAILFRDTFNLWTVVGIFLVISGVAVINLLGGT